MGKKRISLIGDAESEEKDRLKKEIKREQKKLRAGEEPEKAPEKVTTQKESAKIHISGLKGGERVKSLESELEIEAETVARKIKEAEEIAAGPKTAKKTNVKKKRGQKYVSAKMKIDPTRRYPVAEAVNILKSMPSLKFIPTVELHLNCLSKVNLQVPLPHSSGKSRRAVALTPEIQTEIEAGKINFDILFASPDQMPGLAKLAKILGPKGLMPNPKTGSIVSNPEEAAKKAALSQSANIKSEAKVPLIHTTIGKLDQDEEKLSQNIAAILEAVKSQNIRSGYLKSTMSPSIKLDIAS